MVLFFQFMLYSVVGAIACVCDFSIFFLLLKTTNIPPVWATTLSYAGALQLNFLLGYLFIFAPSKKKFWHQLLLTYLVASVGLGLNSLLFAIFVRWLSVFWAKVWVVALVLIWNFTARRSFVHTAQLHPRISKLQAYFEDLN